ncbi:hypothetical protein PR202_gb03823 [Eleusine coracana subsp. coracana]|uniref:Uncharacterized protein n=1 Tax=Eleusine coracana subsp. coracana TaxID=191504 RepID=A0AAV5E277_ELECO|nr:hypothetical protein PR202_gb03823 [Eleusine coracana subsp. coracana]
MVAEAEQPKPSEDNEEEESDVVDDVVTNVGEIMEVEEEKVDSVDEIKPDSADWTPHRYKSGPTLNLENLASCSASPENLKTQRGESDDEVSGSLLFPLPASHPIRRLHFNSSSSSPPPTGAIAIGRHVSIESDDGARGRGSINRLDPETCENSLVASGPAARWW